MQRDEWQALARVILYGFCMLNYYPLRLSPVIISSCFFGEEILSRQFLLEAFHKYVTSEDQRPHGSVAELQQKIIPKI